MQKIVFPISPHGAIRLFSMMLFVCLNVGFTTHQKAAVFDIKAADDWVYHKTVNGVDFYHQIINCNKKTVVLLKFNNKNKNKVKLSWKEVFTTQMEESTVGYNGKKQLFIGPGETFSSGCSDDKIKEILIFPQEVKLSYAATILSFEFKDIDVTLAL